MFGKWFARAIWRINVLGAFVGLVVGWWVGSMLTGMAVTLGTSQMSDGLEKSKSQKNFINYIDKSLVK